MPALLRPLLLCLLLVVGLHFAPSHALAGEANIFIYHRFNESRYPSTNISADVFESHLQHLQATSTKVLALDEVVRRLRAGEPLPDKVAVLTVDDAFSSFLSDGMPLIRKFQVPVTLFVNTDSVGTRGYLNWEQLRALVQEGVAIGNHSATHDYLIEHKPGEGVSEWKQRVRTDIMRATAAFEQELGFAPRLFAYPYGEYSPELVSLVRELGFDAAIAQQSGVVGAGSDLFLLPRFPMGSVYATLEQFRSKLSMHRLDLELLEAVNPVPEVNPPTIKVRIDAQRFDLRRLQGFVQGENHLRIEPVAGSPGVYAVSAEKPLTGRRNKYTLTVPLKSGGWGWFSQPWFLVR